MEKKDLLKTKKAILSIALASTLGLTGCATQPVLKTKFVYEQVDENTYKNPKVILYKEEENVVKETIKTLVTDRIYVDEDGNVVIEKKLNEVYNDGNLEYNVPSGYAITHDENGNTVATAKNNINQSV